MEKFKYGDILIMHNSNTMVIFKDYDHDDADIFYSLYNNHDNNVTDWYASKFRHATEEERQYLLNTLNSEGLYWDVKTKEIKDVSGITMIKIPNLKWEEIRLYEDRGTREFVCRAKTFFGEFSIKRWNAITKITLTFDGLMESTSKDFKNIQEAKSHANKIFKSYIKQALEID
nr:MAG TPA: hypothetical protein [Caudoviricetes sp.]